MIIKLLKKKNNASAYLPGCLIDSLGLDALESKLI
jgi:hypothetical protein